MLFRIVFSSGTSLNRKLLGKDSGLASLEKLISHVREKHVYEVTFVTLG